MRFQSVGDENETFLIRVWKLFSSKRVLKTLREARKGKSPKRTISASSGLELLQMVSNLDTGQCASQEAES